MKIIFHPTRQFASDTWISRVRSSSVQTCIRIRCSSNSRRCSSSRCSNSRRCSSSKCSSNSKCSSSSKPRNRNPDRNTVAFLGTKNRPALSSGHRANSKRTILAISRVNMQGIQVSSNKNTATSSCTNFSRSRW